LRDATAQAINSYGSFNLASAEIPVALGGINFSISSAKGARQ
jgi:hypothetical protein